MRWLNLGSIVALDVTKAIFFAARKSALAFLVTHSEATNGCSGPLELVALRNTGSHRMALYDSRMSQDSHLPLSSPLDRDATQ
jgi:hypothetical protein